MNKLKKDGRKLRSESTADHILNTAIKIARKGNIDSMSFNSIAKEADIGTRTIFRHFKDQESLQDSLDQKLGEEFTSYFSKINKEKLDDMFIHIGTFYSIDTANFLKKRIVKELSGFNNNNIRIKKNNNKEIQVISGPYTSVNSLKNDYIKLKNFGFEELDIFINE